MLIVELALWNSCRIWITYLCPNELVSIYHDDDDDDDDGNDDGDGYTIKIARSSFKIVSMYTI